MQFFVVVGVLNELTISISISYKQHA